MKTFIVFLSLTWGIALSMNAANTCGPNDPDKVETAAGFHFSFTVYGSIPEAQVNYAQSHYLGQPVEGKWNTFLKNYTLVSEQSIGFASTNVQFNKPVIYNAVQKVNKHLKKAVKKGLLSKEEATQILSHVLDCANVACFEPDTEAFEEAISEADTREDIIRVFENTELVFK